MKNINFLSFWLLLILGTATVVFNSCGKDDDSKKEEIKPSDPDKTGIGPATSTTDPGVVINSIRWATRNVDKSGTFAAKPEDLGMFYQWNRKKGWPATGDVTGWDDSYFTGTTWEKANDPSPSGWRVPTLAEIQSLLNTDKVINVWTTQSGVIGIKFTDKVTSNSIFLPAAGARFFTDGTLYNAGLCGYYWSSTAYEFIEMTAYHLYFDDDDLADWYWIYRNVGFNVRPVAD